MAWPKSKQRSLSVAERNARNEEKAELDRKHKELKADFKRRDKLRRDRGRKR